MFAGVGVVALMMSLTLMWRCAARLEEVAGKVVLVNVFEGARLQARRVFFDLNNGGAESPAPSKLLSAAASFPLPLEAVAFPNPARISPTLRRDSHECSFIPVVQPAALSPRYQLRVVGLR